MVGEAGIVLKCSFFGKCTSNGGGESRLLKGRGSQECSGNAVPSPAGNAPPSFPLQERMGGAASRAIRDFVLEWNSQSPRKQDHEFVPTASAPKHCQSSEVCDSFYSFPFPTNCSA